MGMNLVLTVKMFSIFLWLGAHAQHSEKPLLPHHCCCSPIYILHYRLESISHDTTCLMMTRPKCWMKEWMVRLTADTQLMGPDLILVPDIGSFFRKKM